MGEGPCCSWDRCLLDVENTCLILGQEMTAEERKVIKHLDKCDFTEIHGYFVDKTAARKALPKEEKQVGLLRGSVWRGPLGPCVGGCWYAEDDPLLSQKPFLCDSSRRDRSRVW